MGSTGAPPAAWQGPEDSREVSQQPIQQTASHTEIRTPPPLKAASPLKPTSATPEAGFPKPLKPTSAEPSMNRQEPSKVARKRVAGFDAASIELPQWLDRATWAAWVADRRERRKPITARAAEQHLSTLAVLREAGHEPTAVITQSIANGWQGLFEVRGPGRKQTSGNQRSHLRADEVFA